MSKIHRFWTNTFVYNYLIFQYYLNYSKTKTKFQWQNVQCNWHYWIKFCYMIFKNRKLSINSLEKKRFYYFLWLKLCIFPFPQTSSGSSLSFCCGLYSVSWKNTNVIHHLLQGSLHLGEEIVTLFFILPGVK